MSDMLEQAIIDAEALRGAALKNAQTLVLEKYSSQIKDAVEKKRFHHQWIPNQIQIEKHSLSNEVINKLEDMGHDIIYRSNVGIGEANCIMIVNDTYYGVGDSRRGGRASAY